MGRHAKGAARGHLAGHPARKYRHFSNFRRFKISQQTSIKHILPARLDLQFWKLLSCKGLEEFEADPIVASKLHRTYGVACPTAPIRRETQPASPMAKDVQSRFLFVLIALLSVAAVVFAWLNFQKDRETLTPYDGVWWVESGDHLQAQRVDANGPGEKAGIKQGDVLMAVIGHNIHNVGSLEQQFYRTGVWSKATYSLVRRGIPVEAPAHPGSGRPDAVYRPAADCAGLPGHRAVCAATPLDGAQEHTLLCLLPGVVHFLFVPLHRQVQ